MGEEDLMEEEHQAEPHQEDLSKNSEQRHE